MSNKCEGVLITICRIVGKRSGLKPHMTYWLYTRTVRPIYGCLIWFPMVTQRYATDHLSRIQRLARLCITGAIKSTPAPAMETMVKYPSLLGERMEARIHYGSGHTSMGTVVINPIFEMDSNIATTKTSYNKPYQVFRNWKEWRNGEERI